MKAAFPTLLLALAALVSCQTAPAAIPADATSEVYFQRAQAASDQNQFDEALAIYKNFLTDKPDAAPEAVFQARYEVALLEGKKGLTTQAKADFEAILADYNNLDKSGGAPGWVKVLSEKKLQEMKDKAPKAKS